MDFDTVDANGNFGLTLKKKVELPLKNMEEISIDSSSRTNLMKAEPNAIYMVSNDATSNLSHEVFNMTNKLKQCKRQRKSVVHYEEAYL